MARRWKKRIDGEPEGMLKHSRNYPIQQTRAELQARVCVDLNKPHIEIAVYHEIETKNLEIVGKIVWIHCHIASFERI